MLLSIFSQRLKTSECHIQTEVELLHV